MRTVLITLVAALVLCAAVVSGCEDTWTKYHCKPTGNTRYLQFLIYVDDVPVFTYVTQHEGACDDGVFRWK